MNEYARFDEIPSMTLKNIKETKRYGLTDNVKTVYPPTCFYKEKLCSDSKYYNCILVFSSFKTNLVLNSVPVALIVLWQMLEKSMESGGGKAWNIYDQHQPLSSKLGKPRPRQSSTRLIYGHQIFCTVNKYMEDVGFG